MEPQDLEQEQAPGLPPVQTTSIHAGTSQRIVPPQAYDLINDSLAASQAQAAALQDAAKLEGAQREQAAKEIAAYEQAEKARQAALQAQLDQQELDDADMRRHMEAAQAAISGAKFTDYWADKSTGQKIMAGIGLFLGGFSAGLRGGPNHAWDIIRAAELDDLKKQTERIRLMDDRMVQARTGIRDSMAARNYLIREAAAKSAAASQALATRIRGIGMAAAPGVVRTQAEAAAQKIAADAAARAAAMQIQTAPSSTTTTTTTARPPNTAERAAAEAEKSGGYPIFDATGKNEIARIRDKKSADDVRQVMVDMGQLSRILDRLREDLRVNGKSLLNQEVQGKRRALISVAVGLINGPGFMKGGILGDNDRKEYTDLLQGAVYHPTDRALNTLRELNGLVRDKIELNLSSRGVDGSQATSAYMASLRRSPASGAVARPGAATRPAAPAAVPPSAATAPAAAPSPAGTVVDLRDKATGTVFKARKIPDASKPNGFRYERL